MLIKTRNSITNILVKQCELNHLASYRNNPPITDSDHRVSRLRAKIQNRKYIIVKNSHIYCSRSNLDSKFIALHNSLIEANNYTYLMAEHVGWEVCCFSLLDNSDSNCNPMFIFSTFFQSHA